MTSYLISFPFFFLPGNRIEYFIYSTWLAFIQGANSYFHCQLCYFSFCLLLIVSTKMVLLFYVYVLYTDSFRVVSLSRACMFEWNQVIIQTR